MDEIITFSVLFNDKARASTVSYTKAYEIHLGMFQRALRQIIYTELQRQYMAAEEFAAQTQSRNLILAFQRGLRHIAQWDENQMQRFVHGVSAASPGNHLFRMPGDLLQTLSNLVHMLMFTNSDVIDLVENRLTHCPGFSINTEITIGEFVVKCMKEAALHFDSTPFLFSRAEKPQHWIENRQKIMQQIDEVVSIVVHELATSIVTSVCQKLMYQVREPMPDQDPPPHQTGTSHIKPPLPPSFGHRAPGTDIRNDMTTSSTSVPHRTLRVAPAGGDTAGNRFPSKTARRIPTGVSSTAIQGTGVDRHTANMHYNSSSTEANRSAPGKQTLYTDRRLLSGHATDQEYIEHAYIHGPFRNTSTPIQPSTHRAATTENLTASSTAPTGSATVASDAAVRALSSAAPTTFDTNAASSAAAADAAASRPNSVSPPPFTILPTSASTDQKQSGSLCQQSHVSPSASTIAAAVTTQAEVTLDTSVQNKTDSSHDFSAPPTVVTLVVDENTANDQEKSTTATTFTSAAAAAQDMDTEIVEKKASMSTEHAVQRESSANVSQQSHAMMPGLSAVPGVVLENSESRPKPNEAQPLPLMHEQDDAQESNHSVST